MWTEPFAAFVAPARARPGLGRLLLGVLLIVFTYFIGILLVLGLMLAFTGVDSLMGWMGSVALGDTPTAVVLLLATFVGMMLGPILAVEWLHARNAATLFGPRLLTGFATGAIAALALLALSILLPAPFDVTRNTETSIFLSFLPLAILGLLLQTGAEEVLFRGYLQQQLAARFDHWIVWTILPTLAFGALHYDPGSAGANAPLIVAAATLFGLVAADLTRVTGSIGAAWGLHFVNNSMAILLVSLDGTLSGLSWWKAPLSAADLPATLIAQDMIFTIIIWAALRLWFARRA